MCRECSHGDDRMAGPPLSRAQFLKLFGMSAAVLALPGCAGAQQGDANSTELVLHNIKGRTFADGKLRTFTSIHIGPDGRVRALDADAPSSVRRVDGNGQHVLPGLIDAHGHVMNLGAKLDQADLSGTKTIAEAKDKIRQYAAKNPDLPWIRGRGWNDVTWNLGRLPTAADLDEVISDRPVWMVRVDNHAAWANTAALRLAGITAQTPDPDGGHIERDASGQPTGVFVDTARKLVEQKIPAPGPEELKRWLTGAQRHLNSVGITSVGDAATSGADFGLFREFATSGQLTVRINAFLRIAEFDAIGAAERTDGLAGDLLRLRTVKVVSDGALGSHGAALLAGYSDDPASKGLLQTTEAKLRADIEKAVRAGYQVAVHAIGDHGNRVVLDAFEDVFGRAGRGGMRHRVEHAQVVALQDIPRFRTLDLIASMQPSHATDDMNMAETRVGAERIKGAYAWRAFLDQRTVIAAGSDFTASSTSPFDGMHAATTRTDREGKPAGGWHREQAMTLEEAFRAYTLDAAYAAHQETLIGSLEPGKYADLVLLDRDLFDTAQPLWRSKVSQTWLAGRKVFQAEG